MSVAYEASFLFKDYHTENAGTVITEQIPAIDGYRIALNFMSYTAAATAHTASFMYAEGTGSRNTANAATLSGQADIVCASAPKDPAGNAAAANDIVAFQLSDGTWEFGVVQAVNANTITLTGNITGVDAGAGGTAILAGGKVNVFGVVGDNKSNKLQLPASVTTKFAEHKTIPLCPYIGEPMYLSINNATNAGSIDTLVISYINK